MKKNITFILSFLFLLTACANNYIPEAKVTFKVVDMNGNPISNEDVTLGFSPTIGFSGKTDEHGFFTGRGRTESDYVFSVAQDSDKYYRTRFSKQIAHWKYYPKDGKWKPWNETIEVVVKEKLNPIPMYVRSASHFPKTIPRTNEWIGYDFEKDDWLSPDGMGVIADIEIFLTGIHTNDIKENFLKIRFPYPMSGAVFMKKDFNSSLMSIYHADPTANYQAEIIFKDVYVKRGDQFYTRPDSSSLLKKEDYLIFRTRTKVDENGNLLEARYGKIYGPLEFHLLKENNNIAAKQVRIRYHLNPTINDTNLECNGKSLVIRKDIRERHFPISP